MVVTSKELRPVRRTEALHKGRLSLSGARYFVTCSAIRPESRLVDPLIGKALQGVLARLEKSDDCKLLCSTIMPDHIHLILKLNGRLSVGQVVGKFKSICVKTMETKKVKWQRDFFEHRLRPEDSIAGFARYVFLNPYRNKLVSLRQVWSWWQKANDECLDLEEKLVTGMFPPEEWLTMDFEQMGIRAEDVGEERAPASSAPTSE